MQRLVETLKTQMHHRPSRCKDRRAREHLIADFINDSSARGKARATELGQVWPNGRQTGQAPAGRRTLDSLAATAPPPSSSLRTGRSDPLSVFAIRASGGRERRLEGISGVLGRKRSKLAGLR
jgi:hypothetical protein